MSATTCLGSICFVPLVTDTPRLFGFPEFLAGLALMVLAWTIADIRYRFRIQTAPVPLQSITFGVVSIVGVLSLLTDLWRAEQWLVPKGSVLTPAAWQAMLGGLFLLTFLSWAFFAFIRPPLYGKMNAARYAKALYRIILRGSPVEMAVIGDELGLSAARLVSYAPELERDVTGRRKNRKTSAVEAYANDLLLLIADRRFCRSIVSASPGTILIIFRKISETGKYGVQIGTFFRNIMVEALENHDSFLYHETDGYQSGLLGYHKPLTQAMFSDFSMVEKIGTDLDMEFEVKQRWTAAEWNSYCRVVLVVAKDYVENHLWQQSMALHVALSSIERSLRDLQKLNGIDSVGWENESYSRLRVATKFVKEFVGLLEKKGVPRGLRKRIGRHPINYTIYDEIAELVFEIIHSASYVKSPADTCWWIQHNVVWLDLFRMLSDRGAAGRAVQFKIRRLIYDEVVKLRRFPNFKGARILAFCLNVLGFELGDDPNDRDIEPLHKAVLSWTVNNYVWLHKQNPSVAKACLVDGITYAEQGRRLVKSYPARGLQLEAKHSYLELHEAVTDNV